MKALPCIVNGHEPLDEGLRSTSCKWCGIHLGKSKLWIGMSWKIWWTALDEKW